MTTTKNFIVKDNKGNVVFEGIGGDANTWAANNVHKFGDLFIHYYGENVSVLHWFIGDVVDVWGIHHNEVTNEWVA